MQLKEDIIRNINNMDIPELLFVKSMIQKLKKDKSQKTLSQDKSLGAIKVRSVLKGITLSEDIHNLREER